MILLKRNAHSSDAFEIRLPDIPQPETDYAVRATSVYSAKHGLITNYGNSIFRLNVRQYVKKQDDISWEKRINVIRCPNWQPAMCFIDNNQNEKLFACSCFKVLCYSFDDHEQSPHEKHIYALKDMKDSSVVIDRSGIYYDTMSERVYVGGGQATYKQVSYYDVGKDVWMNI